MFCKIAQLNDKHTLTMYILVPTIATGTKPDVRRWRRANGVARWSTQPKDEPMPHTAVPSEIDVRTLVPMQRHQKIFQLVDELAPGGKFVLINDHDPKPLYYQLEAEHPQQFSWAYLERGPEVWRVEICRLSKAA